MSPTLTSLTTAFLALSTRDFYFSNFDACLLRTSLSYCDADFLMFGSSLLISRPKNNSTGDFSVVACAVR